MPKKSKKSRVTIERDGNVVEQVFDYAKFKQMFIKWKQDCGKSGEDLHTKSTTTLFTTVKNHGRTHRPQTSDKNVIGAGEIVERLDELVKEAAELEEEDLKFVDDVIKQLKTVEKKNNPRNILITIPI